MLLTVVNLTNDAIVASLPSHLPPFHEVQEVETISPSQAQDGQLYKQWNGMLLLRLSTPFSRFQDTKERTASKEWLASPESRGMYCSRMTRRHHKLITIPRRNMNSFLAELPDSLPLSALVLPGTHDTMAFYGNPISQCIRVLDVRLAIVKGQLIAFYGVYPQPMLFSSILTSVHAFLSSPQGCRETIVMLIKQEDFAVHSRVRFSQLVRECTMSNPGGWTEHNGSTDLKGMWFLENRIPQLGEVRGKAILFSRFGYMNTNETIAVLQKCTRFLDRVVFLRHNKGKELKHHDVMKNYELDGGLPIFYLFPVELI